MRKALLWGSVLLLLLPAFASAETPAVVKNIKTDFGATCNGVANDVQAFTDFHEWAMQWQATNPGLIELDIPSGSQCMFITSQGVTGVTGNNYSGRFFARGVKKLLVVGYGATFGNSSGTGSSFFYGSDSFTQVGPQPKVATVSAGSNTLTLLNPADASQFTVGAYAVLAGLDLMGYGFPPNPHFFEFVKIVSINGATITLSSPLKNTYESTWPEYWDGGVKTVDLGGPATLYPLDPVWDAEVEYKGLTFLSPGQMYGAERSITFTDMTFGAGDGCPIPSVVKTFTVNHSTLPCYTEVDKMVETVAYNDSTVRSIDIQSSSIDLLQMNNTTITNFLHGTPKKAVISNSTLNDFEPGTMGYGHTDEVVCTNCVIKNFLPVGVTEGGGGSGVDIRSSMTMTNGTITTVSDGPHVWAIPGAKIFFSGYYSAYPGFTVLDISQSGNNLVIQTDWKGGWPPASWGYQNTYLGVRAHPAPKFTCTNCIDGNGAPLFVGHPSGAPLNSYVHGSFSTNFLNSPSYSLWGKITSFKINVTKPYTGTRSSLDLSVGNNPFIIRISDLAVVRVNPTLNLKVAGERVITPSGVTGAQTGDNLSELVNVWNPDNFGFAMPDLSSEPQSTWPTFTFEIITDQSTIGTVAPASSPTPPPPPPSSPAPTPPPPPSSYSPSPTPSPSPVNYPQSSNVQTTSGASGGNGLPVRQIQRSVKVMVDFNPLLSCTAFGLAGSDLLACQTYTNAKSQYNWQPVDWDPFATTTVKSPTNVPTPSAYVFTRSLDVGSRGADVTALQQLLKAQSYFSADATGYFGMVTSGAVAAYQRAHNLEAVGRVGPKTLASLNGQPIPTTASTAATVMSAPTYARVPSGPVCLAIPGSGLMHNLALGMCTTEIQTLQQMLNSLGFTIAPSGDGSPGHEVMSYGARTEAAVIKFQKQYGITSDQRGVVGPATRAKLTELTAGKSF